MSCALGFELTVERVDVQSGNSESRAVPLCNSRDLVDQSDAVPFDVVYCGQTCRGFAIRYQGTVYAYLNRCAHVPVEMDYQPNKFFDMTGHWIICATHGAIYRPETGECRGGPCRGRLVKIEASERDGVVHWHTSRNLQPLEF
jgi:nitrite reductase/ring-hydroxylating ferredoxin subunit